MLVNSTIPPIQTGAASFGGFPLTLDISRLSLGIVFALVMLFFGVLSIILIYHWRRFPYEPEVFDRVEKVYFLVSTILLIVSFTALLIA